MFIETKQFFNYSVPAHSGRPYLNVPQLGFTTFANQSLIANKKVVMDFVKRSPEALGIVRAIAMDIVTRIDFKSIKKQGKGRPVQDIHKRAEDKAREFSRDHQVKQTLLAAIMDMLITGEFFLWIGDNFDEKIKEITKETLKELLGKEVKDEEIKEVMRYLEENESVLETKHVDEDPDGMRQLVYVPSTTMSIKINKEGTGVDLFRQDTHLRVREWKPNQIIHGKLMDLDGKINGYSPMESCIPLIKTLGLITDYHGKFFDSGGVPDLIFVFKQMGANDAGLAKWQQVIDEWALTKRRGHLVIGGEDFSLERVNEMNKDMEFRKLAIYYTGRLAFTFGMPLEKFQAILGSEVKSSSGSSELGNADYMRNTSYVQDYIENLLSMQFWNDSFSVDMLLERGFLQDQVRKLQVDTQRIPVIQGLAPFINKENIPDLIHMHFPDIPREWINENPILPTDNPNPDVLPNDKVQKGEARQSYSEQKKTQQGTQQRTNKPIGS